MTASGRRCRLAAEYALANKITPPRNILIRESDRVPALDEWIAGQFDACRIDATIDALTGAQEDYGTEQQAILQARQTISDCKAKMERYQAAIDADRTSS